MKAKSVKREAKKKRMVRNYFLFVTISVKRYPYLLEFTNCTRKGKNSCTKMQHILSFLDKNNLFRSAAFLCEDASEIWRADTKVVAISEKLPDRSTKSRQQRWRPSWTPSQPTPRRRLLRVHPRLRST